MYYSLGYKKLSLWHQIKLVMLFNSSTMVFKFYDEIRNTKYANIKH